MSEERNTCKELGTKLIILRGGERISDIKAIRLRDGESLTDEIMENDFLSYEEIKEIINNECNDDLKEGLIELDMHAYFQEDAEYEEDYECENDSIEFSASEDDLFSDSFREKHELTEEEHMEALAVRYNSSFFAPEFGSLQKNKSHKFKLKFKVKEKYVGTLKHINKFITEEMGVIFSSKEELTDIFVKSINIMTGQVNLAKLRELLVEELDNVAFNSDKKATKDKFKQLYKKFLAVTPADLMDSAEFRPSNFRVDLIEEGTMKELLDNNNKSVTIDYIESMNMLDSMDEIDIRGNNAYLSLTVHYYELFKQKHKRINKCLGGLLGTLADEDQQMNLNLQAIWLLDYKEKYLVSKRKLFCNVEKITDGKRWGIKITNLRDKFVTEEEQNVSDSLLNGQVIWTSDYAKKCNLSFEVSLHELHSMIYKQMKPIMEINKELGLMSEEQEFVEKLKLLLFHNNPIERYYYDSSVFLDNTVCLCQEEQEVILKHLIENVGGDNEFVKCLQYYVNSDRELKDTEEVRAENIINDIFYNICKVNTCSIEGDEQLIFKFNVELTGAYLPLIESLKDEMEDKQHKIVDFTVEEIE